MPDPTLSLNIAGLDGPLGHRVYITLRNSILNMALEPGTVLRKGALCEQLGVSRSPVAEALGKLSTDGLVDIIPQSATRVSQFSVAELREESFLREAVEVAAVTKVALDATEEQMTRLTRNLRLQSLLIKDKDFQGFFEADLEFHLMILQFTGFPKVVAAAGQVSLQLQRARMLVLPEQGRPAGALAEHTVILEAIRAKDPEAARLAMSGHLRELIKRIVPLERLHPGYFRHS